MKTEQWRQLSQVIIRDAKVVQRSQEVNEGNRQIRDFIVADIESVQPFECLSTEHVDRGKTVHVQVKLLETGHPLTDLRYLDKLVTVQAQIRETSQVQTTHICDLSKKMR